MVVHTCNLSYSRSYGRRIKFQISLGYTVRLTLSYKNKKKKRTVRQMIVEKMEFSSFLLSCGFWSMNVSSWYKGN
jgi:hypothetical protein